MVQTSIAAPLHSFARSVRQIRAICKKCVIGLLRPQTSPAMQSSRGHFASVHEHLWQNLIARFSNFVSAKPRRFAAADVGLGPWTEFCLLNLSVDRTDEAFATCAFTRPFRNAVAGNIGSASGQRS